MLNFDFDAAIFDMDGTLLDTMRYWRYTSLEYLLAHQLPVRPEDLARMEWTSSRALVKEIAEREGFDMGSWQTMVGELEEFMNRHYLHDAKRRENVPELLEKLRGMGKPMCVATGAPRQYARNGLSRLGILKYFEFVTDCYEFGMDKSQPEYFEEVARRLGAKPERCVVFEDALYAMKSAKTAGCRVVAIEDSTARLQRDEIRAIADRYIQNYSELLDE